MNPARPTLTNAPIHVMASTSLAASVDCNDLSCWLLVARSEWAFHPEYLTKGHRTSVRADNSVIPQAYCSNR